MHTAKSDANASASSWKHANAALWTIQGLLALIFAFAGIMKLVLPAAMLKGPVALPIELLRFVGGCETIGAIGLVLPSLLRIKPLLTPIAASGLVIIMIGATIITAIGGSVAGALLPLLVGLLAASVAFGRSRVAPIAERGRSSARDASVARRVA